MSNAQNIFYMLEDCHITCVGIPMGCDLFTIYMILILIFFSNESVGLFLYNISFYLCRFLISSFKNIYLGSFPIRSSLIVIMSIAVQTIWLVYARVLVMT
jgi:hypothetical protein